MRLSDGVSTLTAVFDDWVGVLANPRVTRINRTIAWTGYRGSTHLGTADTDAVQDLIDAGQYSFQFVSDGSVLQLRYSFGDNDGLAWAELAYYGAIGFGPRDDVRWARLDYAPRHSNGIVHAACHLHLSGFPDTRIAAACVPTPAQFVEAIVAWFYPVEYRTRLLGSTGLFKDASRVDRVCAFPFAIPPPDDVRRLLHLGNG